MRLSFSALALCAAASLLASCSSETARPASKRVDDIKQVTAFQRIKDSSLSLEIVSPETEFFRGDVAPKITFRLRNTGLRPITVYEWMAKEQDNIKLSYARCEGVAPEALPPSAWTVYVPKVKAPAARMPLDFYPKNTALVSVELSCIKDALQASGAHGRTSYAIIGELNLNSVSAKSKPFVVTFK